MKIDIQDVFYAPGSEKEFDHTVDLTQSEQDKVFFYAPLSVSGSFKNRSGVVTLDMQVDTNIQCMCDRCLSDFRQSISSEYHHVLTTDETNQNDVIFVPGGVIDLSALVQEDILLELPLKVLCKEDCRGLCMNCGQNLNEANCSCE